MCNIKSVEIMQTGLNHANVLCTCVCSQVCFQVGAFEVCFPTVGMSADVIAGPRRDGSRRGSVCGRFAGWSGSDGGKLQTAWRRCGCLFRGQNHHDWSFGHKQHRRRRRAAGHWKHLEDWKRWRVSSRRIRHRCSSGGWWGMRVYGWVTVCVWRVPNHADRLRSSLGWSRDPWPKVRLAVGAVRWSHAWRYLKKYNQFMIVFAYYLTNETLFKCMG